MAAFDRLYDRHSVAAHACARFIADGTEPEAITLAAFVSVCVSTTPLDMAGIGQRDIIEAMHRHVTRNFGHQSSSDERWSVALAMFGNFTYQEIARLLDISDAAVLRHMLNGLAKLHAHLPAKNGPGHLPSG